MTHFVSTTASVVTFAAGVSRLAIAASAITSINDACEGVQHISAVLGDQDTPISGDQRQLNVSDGITTVEVRVDGPVEVGSVHRDQILSGSGVVGLDGSSAVAGFARSADDVLFLLSVAGLISELMRGELKCQDNHDLPSDPQELS